MDHPAAVFGFYYDSDAMYTDDTDTLRLDDIAPNISQTQGGTHNTLFIATNSYLIAVEAPNDDSQAIQSINVEKYPETDPLPDSHPSPCRSRKQHAHVRRRAPIVVSKGDGDYFRKSLARPETLNNEDGLHGKSDREVDGKWSVNDGGREVRVCHPKIRTRRATTWCMSPMPASEL